MLLATLRGKGVQSRAIEANESRIITRSLPALAMSTVDSSRVTIFVGSDFGPSSISRDC